MRAMTDSQSNSRDWKTVFLWLAYSMPVPLFWSVFYDTLTSTGAMWDREQNISRVGAWLETLLLLLPPLTVALFGWIWIVRRNAMFATSRTWHSVSLAFAVVLTVILHVVWVVLFLVVVTGSTIGEEFLERLDMTKKNVLWLEWIASPVLVILIPRMLLARRLRTAGFVAFP
jgi:hypothetical protein